MFFIAKKPERVKSQWQFELLSASVETTTLSYFTVYWDKCMSRNFAGLSGLLYLFFMPLPVIFARCNIFTVGSIKGVTGRKHVGEVLVIRAHSVRPLKRGEFVLIEVFQFSKKMKQKINIDERNGRAFSGGRFGALSTRNLFHFRFPLHKV